MADTAEIHKKAKLADITKKLEKAEGELEVVRSKEFKEKEKRIKLTEKAIRLESRDLGQELKDSLLDPIRQLTSVIPKPLRILGLMGWRKLMSIGKGIGRGKQADSSRAREETVEKIKAAKVLPFPGQAPAIPAQTPSLLRSARAEAIGREMSTTGYYKGQIRAATAMIPFAGKLGKEMQKRGGFIGKKVGGMLGMEDDKAGYWPVDAKKTARWVTLGTNFYKAGLRKGIWVRIRGLDPSRLRENLLEKGQKAGPLALLGKDKKKDDEGGLSLWDLITGVALWKMLKPYIIKIAAAIAGILGLKGLASAIKKLNTKTSTLKSPGPSSSSRPHWWGPPGWDTKEAQAQRKAARKEAQAQRKAARWAKLRAILSRGTGSFAGGDAAPHSANRGWFGKLADKPPVAAAADALPNEILKKVEPKSKWVEYGKKIGKLAAWLSWIGTGGLAVWGAADADKILDKDPEDVDWKDRLAAGAARAFEGVSLGLAPEKVTAPNILGDKAQTEKKEKIQLEFYQRQIAEGDPIWAGGESGFFNWPSMMYGEGSANISEKYEEKLKDFRVWFEKDGKTYQKEYLKQFPEADWAEAAAAVVERYKELQLKGVQKVEVIKQTPVNVDNIDEIPVSNVNPYGAENAGALKRGEEWTAHKEKWNLSDDEFSSWRREKMRSWSPPPESVVDDPVTEKPESLWGKIKSWIPGFAQGGTIPTGSIGLTGEAGPELAVSPSLPKSRLVDFAKYDMETIPGRRAFYKDASWEDWLSRWGPSGELKLLEMYDMHLGWMADWNKDRTENIAKYSKLSQGMSLEQAKRLMRDKNATVEEAMDHARFLVGDWSSTSIKTTMNAQNEAKEDFLDFVYGITISASAAANTISGSKGGHDYFKETITKWTEVINALGDLTTSTIGMTTEWVPDVVAGRTMKSGSTKTTIIDEFDEQSYIERMMGVPGKPILEYAKGGKLPMGRFGIVGEAGPELVRGPATIIPLTGKFAGKFADGGIIPSQQIGLVGESGSEMMISGTPKDLQATSAVMTGISAGGNAVVIQNISPSTVTNTTSSNSSTNVSMGRGGSNDPFTNKQRNHGFV